MKFDFSHIQNSLHSIEHMNAVYAQFSEISESIYVVKNDTEKQMKNLLSEALYQAITDDMKKNNINSDNKKQFQEFIVAAMHSLKNLPKITLYLGFEPKTSQMERIASWFSVNITPPPLIEVIYNPLVMAGSVIEYKGRHADYSLGRAETRKK